QLTRGPGENQCPSWSPDSSHIAFMSNRNENWQLYMMDADGSRQIQLTKTLNAFNPSWSPRGNRIVFYTDTGDHRDQIMVIGADGADEKRLTDSTTHNFFPSWSSDGSQILFTSDRGGKNELSSMNANGSLPRRLPVAPSFFGRWSPDGLKIAYISGSYPV